MFRQAETSSFPLNHGAIQLVDQSYGAVFAASVHFFSPLDGAVWSLIAILRTVIAVRGSLIASRRG
jgi:hypothetical protein